MSMRDAGQRGDGKGVDGRGFDSTGSASRSRALAVIQGGGTGADGPMRDEPRASLTRYRADAAFLAHLLAVRTHAPAQRAKRRAAPEVGAAAYEPGLGLLAAAPRRTLGIEA
jgi:hypothetical protein